MKPSTILDIPIKNVFDLLALLCYFLHNAPREEAVTAYKICTSDIEKQKQKVEDQFSFLNRKSTTESVTYISISTEHCSEMAQVAVNWNDHLEYSHVLGLLLYLDGYIDFERSLDLYMSTQKMVTTDIFEFEGLNVSNMNTLHGRLIPRIIPIWRKTKYKCPLALAKKPLGLLRNYSWLPDNEWKIHNFYLRNIAIDKSKPLKIVCSALTSRSPFNFQLLSHTTPHTFTTEYIEQQEQEIISRIIKTLLLACEEEAFCVLFPEMLASPSVLDACQKYISNEWKIRFPPLIFLPTAEYPTADGRMVNELRIVDSSGTKIVSYHKQEAYEHIDKDGRSYFEQINADKQLVSFHVKGIGRIGTLICADVFNDSILNLLTKEFGLDLLLISVFSSGWDAFGRALSAYENAACDIVWCNTCAAYNDCKGRKNIVYFPYGHKERIAVEKTGCDNASNCTSCATIITIPPSYEGLKQIKTANLNRGEQDEQP